MKYLKTALWIAVIVVIFFAAKQNLGDTKQKIDVTDLRSATPNQVESRLGVKCVSEPMMSEKIFEYSNTGGVTVKGDIVNGIGVVYLNGVQSGLIVENSQYKLFNIAVGKSRVGMESAMTFSYEKKFEINEIVEQELNSDQRSFPVFYCNWTNNDCVVVTCEKSTGIVEAVTYFNNAKKVTEKLVFSGQSK